MSTFVDNRRIAFGDIEAGDKLRVRHSVGGSAMGQRISGYGPNTSVTRTLVATVAVKALGTVWLSADGHTVAHTGWDDLEIIRLSGEVLEVENRSGLPWTEEDMQVIRDWGKSDRIVAAQLGRTYAAVVGRRSMLRKGLLNA